MVLRIFHGKGFGIHDSHTVGFVKKCQALPENTVLLSKHILQFTGYMAEQLVVIQVFITEAERIGNFIRPKAPVRPSRQGVNLLSVLRFRMGIHHLLQHIQIIILRSDFRAAKLLIVIPSCKETYKSVFLGIFLISHFNGNGKDIGLAAAQDIL